MNKHKSTKKNIKDPQTDDLNEQDKTAVAGIPGNDHVKKAATKDDGPDGEANTAVLERDLRKNNAETEKSLGRKHIVGDREVSEEEYQRERSARKVS